MRDPNAETIKQFEAALRQAHALSKARRDPVKKTTRSVPVEGFPGWRVRYYQQASKFHHFDAPCFEVTGPTGKVAHAGTGRFKELAQKCVRAGNGTPVDTNFITAW